MYPVYKMRLFACLLAAAISCVLSATSHDHAGNLITISKTWNVNAVIHLNNTPSNLTHFWESTGFCPPAPHNESWHWLESESMVQNLLYISSLPFNAVKQVRIHWLLDLITITQRNGEYNFTKLDTLLDRLHMLRLKPGFELMGNPGGAFTNLDDPVQVTKWRDLIHTLAKHYVDRYGVSYVKGWNFETWNEPKIGHFDNLNVSLKGFLNYYDASVSGLKMASADLRLGGPGGECKRFSLDHYCWAWLEHIQQGKDFFTGKLPYIPDFLSIHKKGEEPDNTDSMLQKEESTLETIHQHFPRLLEVPVFNDEADPLVGWSKIKPWRADVTYAAMVAKIIARHDSRWNNKNRGGPHVKFDLLSNDNGFLSYQPDVFSQRTLLARFQVNETQNAGVRMIAKPAYSVMGLLALLGDQKLSMDISGTKGPIGILATGRNVNSKNPQKTAELSILIYNSNDTYNSTCQGNVRLSFSGQLQHTGSMRLSVFQMDNTNGNPYRLWTSFGSPSEPSHKQFKQMRKAEHFTRTTGPVDFSVDNKLNFRLPQPGVSLVQICVKPNKLLGKVKSVRIQRVSKDELLLTWDDSDISTRCILTHSVQYSTTGERYSFKHIHRKQMILFNYFVVDKNALPGPSTTFTGYYRVRAVDIWSRKGGASEPCYYNS